MGNRWDLGQSGQGHFKECADLIVAKKGHISQFDEAILVDQIREFSFVIMKAAVFHAMANGWLRCTQWAMLAKLIRRFGSDRVDAAIERLNGRENYSLDTLEGILVGSIPARRKQNASEVSVKPKSSQYPDASGIYDRAAAMSWLYTHGHSLNDWPQFFEQAGREPDTGFPLLRLNSEYR